MIYNFPSYHSYLCILKCVSCSHLNIGSCFFYANNLSLLLSSLDYFHSVWLWIWLGWNLSSCYLFFICSSVLFFPHFSAFFWVDWMFFMIPFYLYCQLISYNYFILVVAIVFILEKDLATHSSILAWRTPWTEEPGGLQSMGPQRARLDWVTKHRAFITGLPRWLSSKESAAKQETWVQFLGWEDPLEKDLATHSSILAWKFPRTKEPGSGKSHGQRSGGAPVRGKAKESGRTQKLNNNGV